MSHTQLEQLQADKIREQAAKIRRLEAELARVQERVS